MKLAGSLDSYEDIDYSPVYGMGRRHGGFRIVHDSDEDDIDSPAAKRSVKGFTLYDAIKIRMYGHTEIEYPSYYLEDWEEIELSASDIYDLDGIQFCIHTKNFDLSDNYIRDLTLLSGLTSMRN